MKIVNKLKNIVLGTILAGTMALNSAQAGVTGGIEGTVGTSGFKLKSPSDLENITLQGYTGTGINGNGKKYNLPLSNEKKFSDMVVGFAPYVRYTSEDNSWIDFKIGKEFSFRYSPTTETRTVEEGKYYLSSICDNDWGYWPNAGVYADVKMENLFFVDKNLMKWGDKREGYDSSLSLLFKLNKYSADYTAFTARTPYGSEWYGPLSDTITSSKKLGKENGLGANLGLRAEIVLYQDDFMPVHLFIEGSYGIPIADFISPTMEARVGWALGW